MTNQPKKAISLAELRNGKNKQKNTKHSNSELVYSSKEAKKPVFQDKKFQNFQEWQKKNYDPEIVQITQFKKNREEEKEKPLKERSLKLIEKIFKIKSKENYSKNFLEVVELLKTEPIKEVIVSGSFSNKNEPSIDLDTRGALNLLNNYNRRNYKENYTDTAKTTVLDHEQITKYLKSLKKKDKDSEGIIITVDAGGNWLRVFNESNNKETIVTIDHHGHGEGPITSGTRMTYNLMKQAGILKEEYWMKDYVEAINSVDNLDYIYRKDREGKYTFNKEFFVNSWTRSLAAFAEKEISFQDLIKLFKEGKIKDISRPLNNYELNGEIGNIIVNIKNGKNYQKMPLREGIEIKKREAFNSLRSAKEILKYNNQYNKLVESEDLGNILYQNYQSKKKMANGREIINKIDNQMAFKVLKAMGGNTYIVWNLEHNYFYINSDYKEADLQLLAEVFNYIAPGSAIEARGRFIFGKIKNLNEERFLDIIKNYKNIAKDINLKEEKKVEDKAKEIKKNKNTISKNKSTKPKELA